LKVFSQKSHKPSKRDRQLLREYRIKKWIDLPESLAAEQPNAIIQPRNTTVFKSCCTSHPIRSLQTNKQVKTMQERALSNLSKIEFAVDNKNIAKQQRRNNFDPLLKSADSGIWCDLTNDKSNKHLNHKTCANVRITKFNQCSDSCHSSFSSQLLSADEANCNHQRSETTDLIPISLSCNSNTTKTKKQTRNPQIVACSWYQNSKCISQTDIHSKDFQRQSSDANNRDQQHLHQQSSQRSSIIQHLKGRHATRSLAYRYIFSRFTCSLFT